MIVKKQKRNVTDLKRTVFTAIRCCICFPTFFFIIFTGSVLAQSVYGDEWIKTNQTHFRIPVSKTGFYKITSQELESAGFSVEKIPAESLQMFRRGKELAIDVAADKSVSFYGERNDGAMDSSLYVNPQAMPHAHYSLYSDTAAYFLTYRRDGGLGKRIEKKSLYKSEKNLDYHFEEASEIFNSNYFTGNFYPKGASFETGSVLSTYDIGEGWTGKELTNTWQTLDINTSNLIIEHLNQGLVEIVLVGRSAGMHEVEIWSGKPGVSGKKIEVITLSDYSSSTYQFPLNETFLVSGKLILSLHAIEKTGSISVSYIKWRYPQKSILPKDIFQKEFYFKNDSIPATWNVSNVQNWKFYDVSDPYLLKGLNQDGSNVRVDGNEKIIGIKDFLKVSTLKLVNVKPVDSLRFDYLIITHPLVRKSVNGIDPVEAYANYRASKEGGSYKPFVIEIDEIFNHFNYGDSGPQAIRNIIAKFQKQLKFVFIIGRSTDPQTARKLNNAREQDMIPNAGWPGSDLALSMGLEGSPPFVPLIPIGRINAVNSEEVWTYLQKVKAMESQPASAAWRKNILHLSGGRSKDEILAFKAYVNAFEDKIKDSILGANVHTISKQTDAEVEQFPIHVPVNKGVALITLYGHSSLDVTDIDIGYASDEQRQYHNHPYYPAVIVNGCALGSIFYSTKTISSDWIFSPNNGAVLFLAHTFNGVSSALKHYTDSFYEVLADSQFVSKPFGVIQKEAIRRTMLAFPNVLDGITAQQMNLHGDPAIRIFPAKLPDYTFDSTLISIDNLSENQMNLWSDSLVIRVGVVNNGRFRNENYTVSIIGKNDSNQSFAIQTDRKSSASEDTLSFKIPNPFKNPEKVSVTFSVDPEDKFEEENETNNVLTKELNIPEGGAFPVLPLPNFKTHETQIELVAQIPFDRKNKEVVFEWDTLSSLSSAQKFTAKIENFMARHTIFIPAKSGQKIYWRVYLPEDVNRPSQSRSIIFSPDNELTTKLPEGMAFSPIPTSTEIQEGDTFQAIASFQNITENDFADSLEIAVTHFTSGEQGKSLLKFPPLKAREILNMPVSFPTMGEIGEHQILVEFNVNKQPEAIYSNNHVQYFFHVKTDVTPPILNVNVDGRQIHDQESVSSQPVIDIQLLDENKFLVRNDTTGIKVFIREDCPNCKEQKISLANAVVSSPFPNDFRLSLKSTQPLRNGTYFLRVKARDLSGNSATDYQIRFRIQNTSRIINAGVSPNPAKQWFRFYVEQEGDGETPLTIHIYDLKGRDLKQIDSTLHAGINECFWQPVNLPPGMYFYRIDILSNQMNVSDEAGSGMLGKLIWVR